MVMENVLPVVEVAVAVQLAAEDAAKEQAEKELRSAITCAKRGGRAVFGSVLAVGRHLDNFIRGRMLLAPATAKQERANAVKRSELAISMATGEPVNVSRYLTVFHAHSLLVTDTPLTPLTYSYFRDVFHKLVERMCPGTVEEYWDLLPGHAVECQELYTRTVRDGLAMDSAAKEVALIVAKRVATVREEDKLALAVAKTDMLKAERAAEVARDEVLGAAKAAAQATADVKAATDDAARKVATENFQASQEELRARQRDEIATSAVLEQKARDEARLAKVVNTPPKKARVKAETTLPTIESIAKGTVKDCAAAVMAILDRCEEPDDLVMEILSGIVASSNVCAVSKRAAQAALVIMSAPAKASHVVAHVHNMTPMGVIPVDTIAAALMV